jgi:hypothetical protein
LASLIVEGLPAAARQRLDSIRVRLGDDRITVFRMNLVGPGNLMSLKV